MRWLRRDVHGRCEFLALGALILSFAIVGAGCESGGTAGTAGRPVASASAGADPQWWIEELRSLQKQYLETISLNCRSAGPFGYDQCMKGKILESLSPDGEAGGHCPQDEIMSLFVECIDRLTTAERAYIALGRDPAQDMNWADPLQSIEDVSRLIGLRLASECLESRQRDCLAREIAYMFAADPVEADRCAALDIIGQVRCAIGLSMMEKIRSAMLYVG